MAKEAFPHPTTTEFPFIELGNILVGRRMRTCSGIEVVACQPVEVDNCRGSYFNTVRQKGDKIFIRTMMGRSDKRNEAWVYARDEVHELDKSDPNYKVASGILADAA